MEKFLPLFPLNLIVYPQEKLNLHIFEDRYKQMIGECIDQKSTFGIPTFLNNQVGDYGTEVKVTQIVKKYDDGRMDISTKGVSSFKVLTFDNPTKGKLYAGGMVQMIQHNNDNDELIKQELLAEIHKLYEVLQVTVEINQEIPQPISFQIAHKVGLSPEQEYELLRIQNEIDRQTYILNHLRQAIPIIEEMERTKEIIRMNGHFKNLDPLKF